LVGLFFGPEDVGNIFFLMVGFSGLHGIMSQKIELFLTTAVRTSNPTISEGK
jgi:hypothetical protein